MKTLNEFLYEIEHLTGSHHDNDDCHVANSTELCLFKAGQIIREFMYFVGSRFGNNSDLETEINKILNGEESNET